MYQREIMDLQFDNPGVKNMQLEDVSMSSRERRKMQQIIAVIAKVEGTTADQSQDKNSPHEMQDRSSTLAASTDCANQISEKPANKQAKHQKRKKCSGKTRSKRAKSKSESSIRTLKSNTGAQQQSQGDKSTRTSASSINRRNPAGETKLFRAVVKHDLAQVSQLVNAGAGWYPIHAAAHPEILHVLLTAGADCNAIIESTGNTPLHLAAQVDNMAGANILLKFGANPRALNCDRKTPADLAPSLVLQNILKNAEFDQHVDVPPISRPSKASGNENRLRGDKNNDCQREITDMTEGTDSTVTSHTNRNLLQTNKSGQNAKHNENTKQTKQKTHQCISNQSQQSTPGELQTSSQVTSHCEKTQQIAKDRNDADVVTVLVDHSKPLKSALKPNNSISKSTDASFQQDMMLSSTDQASQRGPARIMVQPESQNVMSQSYAILQCEAHGEPPLKFQWFQGRHELTDNMHSEHDSISGANTDMLILRRLRSDKWREREPGSITSEPFKCTVSNRLRTTVSAEVMITVNESLVEKKMYLEKLLNACRLIATKLKLTPPPPLALPHVTASETPHTEAEAAPFIAATAALRAWQQEHRNDIHSFSEKIEQTTTKETSSFPNENNLYQNKSSVLPGDNSTSGKKASKNQVSKRPSRWGPTTASICISEGTGMSTHNSQGSSDSSLTRFSNIVHQQSSSPSNKIDDSNVTTVITESPIRSPGGLFQVPQSWSAAPCFSNASGKTASVQWNGADLSNLYTQQSSCIGEQSILSQKYQSVSQSPSSVETSHPLPGPPPPPPPPSQKSLLTQQVRADGPHTRHHDHSHAQQHFRNAYHHERRSDVKPHSDKKSLPYKSRKHAPPPPPPLPPSLPSTSQPKAPVHTIPHQQMNQQHHNYHHRHNNYSSNKQQQHSNQRSSNSAKQHMQYITKRSSDSAQSGYSRDMKQSSWRRHSRSSWESSRPDRSFHSNLHVTSLGEKDLEAQARIYAQRRKQSSSKSTK